MRRVVHGIGVVLPALLLTMNGCVATRSWVQETLGKRTDQIDQRVSTIDAERRQDATRLEGVEVSVRESSQRVEGLGRQVQGLEGAVGQASETAKDARTRADEVDARLTRLWDSRNVRKLADSVSLQFAFNSAELQNGALTALANLVRELKQNPKLLVELEGYADSRGPREYNVQLSQRRVEAVRRHLVQNGVEVSRIEAIGLGALADPKLNDAAKRRVTVKLMVLAD